MLLGVGLHRYKTSQTYQFCPQLADSEPKLAGSGPKLVKTCLNDWLGLETPKTGSNQLVLIATILGLFWML
jgi:hypothetical protein